MLKFRPLRWLRYRKTKQAWKRKQRYREIYHNLVKIHEIAASGGIQSIKWISKDKGL